jgi:hypothetical protein
MFMEREPYFEPEEVEKRAAATEVGRIVHEFGDPNGGNYRDPYDPEAQTVYRASSQSGQEQTMR